MKIYLASQSPRRQELLRQLGVQFDLLLPGADEDAEALEATIPGEPPAVYVQRVVQAKAHAARARLRQRALPSLPILVADTTVALGRELLGKPHNAAENTRLLRLLSDQTHRVLTGVALVKANRIDTCLSISKVTFGVLTAAQIRRYAHSREGWDKAGGYAIQGAAGVFVSNLSGSYSGIVGLPLHETANLLKLHR
jgi:septum formation protein